MQNAWYARHQWKIFLCFILLCPAVLLGGYHAIAEKRTDFQSWLPRDSQATRQYRWFRQYFGEDQSILLSWDGCTLEDERLDLFSDSLLAEASDGSTLSYFTSVVTGKDLVERMQSQNAGNDDFGRQQAINRLRGTVIGPDGLQTCAVAILSEHGERQQELPGC